MINEAGKHNEYLNNGMTTQFKIIAGQFEDKEDVGNYNVTINLIHDSAVCSGNILFYKQWQ